MIDRILSIEEEANKTLILEYLGKHESIANKVAQNELGLTKSQAQTAFAKLISENRIRAVGEGPSRVCLAVE